MFKDIISDQDGLYRNPFDAAVVKDKGDNPFTRIISKYVPDLFVAISPYGAQVIPPGTPSTTMKGNLIAEFPFNTNEMNYAQEGGVASQQQQIIQKIVMMLQEGADPPEVMQQLVKMGIPSQQAEQLLTAVIEQMQSQMQGQEVSNQDMPMAMAGGRACIDCEEQFPQAQNLNWFYKAEGGEAFPQANPYPHMYADGGEAFPQAVNMNAFMGKSSNDFMFQSGGTLYDYVKSMGLDPSFKSRKELFKDIFGKEYVGSAEQNIFLLNALKSGKIQLPGSKNKPNTVKKDGRKIPQTGVVVDKRSGEAVLLGNNKGYQFPVLTGADVEANYSPQNSKSTPVGYYIMNNLNNSGKRISNLNEFEGNYGSWLNPISAYGVEAPTAYNIALHGTYDIANRNKLYTGSPSDRNISSGCVNCRKEDYENILQNIGLNDTVMVVDTKNKKDKELFMQAQQMADRLAEKEKQAKMYTTLVTDFSGVTGSGYEYGGTIDIDQAYQIMKRGGMDMNPKKKKGGKFTPESFEEYVMRNGGYLPKHQGPGQSQVDDMNWLQRARYNVKDFFTPGQGTSITTRGPKPSNSYYGMPYDGPDEGRAPSWAGPMTEDQQRQGINQSYYDNGDITFDQSRGDGLPTVTLDKNGNIVNRNQNQQQSQQQSQQPLYGPGSVSDITVRQNQQMNPFGSYMMGRGLTDMFGSRFGALSGLINMTGATLNSPLFGGRSRMSYVDPATGKRVRMKNSAADIAAAGMFGMLPNLQQQQQQQPEGFSTNYGYSIPNAPQIPGDKYKWDPSGKKQAGGTPFKYTTYVGNNFGPLAYSAGVADQLTDNRLEEMREQAYNRSTLNRFPAPAATKTIGNSPAGSINDRGFVPNTVESSWSPGSYLSAPLQNQQYGGNILDQFEDGGVYDMDGMSEEEIRNFVDAIYAAGGSVEYL